MIILWTQVSGHDFRMAIYEIYDSDGQYQLDIRFDIEDLQRSIQSEFDDIEGDWTSRVEEYVRKHFYLKFNGEIALIRFSDRETDKDFITLHATLGGIEGTVETIDVFNTCLINEIEDHSNLIQVNLHGKKRYFRLSKERIRTLVEY